MAIGLTALLDDIAALAKLAAASVDDIGAAAGRASVKTAGVVVDDAAVTPAYVRGLAAHRELPIIGKIAKGSLRNKLVFILPAALVLSAVAPVLVEIILMLGGTYLAFEGAEKVHHYLHRRRHGAKHGAGHGDAHAGAHGGGHAAAAVDGDGAVLTLTPEAEAATVSGAIRTDFILSAEIMVIALKEVLDEPLVARALTLVVVALLITAAVYGVVALIVKMDDIGLRLAEREAGWSRSLGRGLVAGMPKLLTVLTVVGTAAMLWVGGHILLVGAHELGWHTPYDLVHDLESLVADTGAIGGVLAWFVNTLASAVLGFAVGSLVIRIVALVQRIRTRPSPA
jgi:predicted DNA repair protein MutK